MRRIHKPAISCLLSRYLLGDMVRHGRRSAFIFLTLMLVSAAMLAALSLADTMVRTGTRLWQAEYGQSDILIQASRQADRRTFSEFAADCLADEYEVAAGRLTSTATVACPDEPLSVSVIGARLADLVALVDLNYVTAAPAEPFAGGMAVISRQTAERLAVQVGDPLILIVNGNKHAVVIQAIAYAEGPFAFEAQRPVIVLPLEKVQSALGEQGRVDSLMIRLLDPTRKAAVMRALAAANPALLVSESYTEDHARLQANRTQVPFILMSVIVSFMALYVLTVLFAGLVADHLPLMGIFRALGARQRATNGVLLLECLFYGLLGGMAGWGAGILLLVRIIRSLNQGTPDRYLELAVGLPQLLLSLAVTLVTSLAAAGVSLQRAAAGSISRQIRGLVARPFRRRPDWLAGAGLMIIALTILWFWQSAAGLIAYLVCVIALLAGLVLLTPAIQRLSIGLLFSRHWNGLPAVAIMNCRRSPDFVALVRILALIVATVVIVQSITYSDRRGQEQLAARTHYAFELTMPGLDRARVSRISQVDGVDDICALYTSGAVEVKDQTLALFRVQGVPAYFDPEFYDLHLDDPGLLDRLADGRNILLTRIMGQLYGVKVGESITLRIFARDRVYREVAYTVIGFFDDYQVKLGRYALIGPEAFRADFAATTYDSLIIKSADPPLASAALASAVGRQVHLLQSQTEWQAQIARESRQVIASLQLISLLAVLIGLVGAINLAILSFGRRKREIGLLYALGVDSAGLMRLFAQELLLAGLAGVLLGLGTGLLIVGFALPRLIFALMIAMRLFIDGHALWLGPPAGLIVAAGVSLFSLFYLHRGRPMDGLRQEE
jgi:putative ABC transport system permease protein